MSMLMNLSSLSVSSTLHYEMCSYTFILSYERKVSAFIAKGIPDHRVDSIKLRETLRQITQKRCTAQT